MHVFFYAPATNWDQEMSSITIDKSSMVGGAIIDIHLLVDSHPYSQTILEVFLMGRHVL